MTHAIAAHAQTHTETFDISGGTGFTGSIGGNIDVIVQPSSQGLLEITDLDIRTVSSGGFGNVFPNSTSNNNTASTPIDINASVIGISVPTTNFSSPVTGSFDVTAGDNTANGIVGVLDGGVPGSDGKWDDPGQSSILNNATLDGFSGTLTNDITAPANVSGNITASIPSDITIPDIVDTSILNVDLRLKSSSSVSVDFEPAQSLSIENLSISSSTPVPLTIPASGNFVDGSHPVPGASATLDLSAGAIDVAVTTISGNLVADIQGTINGNVDLAADISVLGIVDFTVDFNDVVDGQISDGIVSLINLDETVALPDANLPFIINVLHQANADVDFDDVTAAIQSGTLGLTIPIELLEEDLTISLPATGFQISGESFAVDEGFFAKGTVFLDNLEAELSGDIVLDLDADLDISADLLATAFESSLINVVPEPSSVLLMACAGVALVGAHCRRRRRTKG